MRISWKIKVFFVAAVPFFVVAMNKDNLKKIELNEIFNNQIQSNSNKDQVVIEEADLVQALIESGWKLPSKKVDKKNSEIVRRKGLNTTVNSEDIPLDQLLKIMNNNLHERQNKQDEHLGAVLGRLKSWSGCLRQECSGWLQTGLIGVGLVAQVVTVVLLVKT